MPLSGPYAPAPRPNPRGGRREALAMLKSGRLKEARKLYRQLLSGAPQDPEIHHYLGIISLQTGRPAEAVKQIRKAVALKPDYASAHNNLGQALDAAGRPGDAEGHYRRALELDSGFFEAHNNLGNALLKLDKTTEAVGHYRAALNIRPDYAEALFNLGTVLRGIDEPEEALACFERAAALKPIPEAFANVAALHERAGRLEAAKTALEKALGLNPNLADARLTLAKALIQEKDWPAARRELSALLKSHGKTRNRDLRIVVSAAAKELGKIDEREKKFESAMKHFAWANRVQAENHPGLSGMAASFFKDVDALINYFRNMPEAAADPTPAPGSGDRPDPVFMVGVPRSGTTLLLKILSTRPDVEIIDEKPILSFVIKKMEALGFPYPTGLDRLTAEDIAVLRDEYWRRADVYLPEGRNRSVVVDKDPPNLIHLGLVSKLFPGARVLVSLRDPRDVCFSCFANIFLPTPLLANFNTFKGTVTAYAAMMDLWQVYRRVLPLPQHIVRYETLVLEMEKETKEIASFLGLEWLPAMLDYYRPEVGRMVNTPSYNQVNQKPYTSSMGRWLPFRDHLQDGLPILAPYLEAFGYEQPTAPY